MELTAEARRIANRYLLGDRLGHGGTGDVFHAFDTVERRVVALKLLHGADPDASGLFRFKREFRAATGLRHPHLVEVYDFGVDPAGSYFTMELVSGPALATGFRWPVAEVVDAVAQVLLATGYIHARGLLHRDLKPDNIRATAEGHLKVLDLGLLEPIGLRHVEDLSGTLTYMAPEAIAGKPLSVAADLYAIGVLAYELLAGEPPFPHASPSELIDAHLRQEPPPLGPRVPDLPEGIEAVVMALLAKDPGKRPQRGADVLRALRPWLSPVRLAAEAAQAHSFLLAPDLVGRTEELALLLIAARDLAAGRGGGALVSGDAGVGKSRLVQEFRFQCQLDGLPFVTASCPPDGAGPYGLVRRLLAGVAPLASDRQLAHYGPTLGSLLPGATPAGGEVLDKAALHGAISAFVAAVATSRPMVLCAEDLQWADALSVEALACCFYEHRDVPVFWLATHRPEEVPAHHPLRHLLAEHAAWAMPLSPFSSGQLAELVRGMLGTPSLPDGMLGLLEETTFGNGFFVVEMLRYLVDQGLLQLSDGVWRLSPFDPATGIPRSVESLVARRLDALSPEAQVLARLGAVVGQDLDPALLDALTEWPERTLLDALNGLLAARLLVTADHGYRFAHDMVRVAIYRTLSPEERTREHQHVAEVLEHLGSPAAQLAHHFGLGEDERRGVRYLALAGQDAERMGAMHEACRRWREAVEILEAHPGWDMDDLLVELWLDLGMKCGFSVDSEVGEAALRKALARLEAGAHPVAVAHVLRAVVAALRLLPGDVATRVMDRLTPRKRYRWRPRKGWRRWVPHDYLGLLPVLIEAYTWLAVCCNSNGQIAQAIEANQRAQQLVPDKRSWAWGVVMTAYAYSRVLEGRFDESIRLARLCFGLIREAKDPNSIRMACGALVLANNQVYQGGGLEPGYCEELQRRAEQHQLTEWQGMVHYAAMVHHALTGRTDRALAAIAQAEPFSRRCGRGTVLEREIRLATARVHALRGEHERAFAEIEAGIALDAVVPLPYFTSRFFEIRGRIHLEMGDLDQAAGAFLEVLHREERSGVQFTVPEAYLGLSEVARQRGELEVAEAQLAAAEQVVEDRRYRSDLKRVYVQRQRGRLSLSRGQWDVAHQHLVAALRLADALDNPWQAALALTDLGRLARAQGREAQARELWNRAAERYAEIGHERGVQLLAALVADPGQRSGTDALAREVHRIEALRRFSEAVGAAVVLEDVQATLLTHVLGFLGCDRGALVRLVDGRVEPVLALSDGRLRPHEGPRVPRAALERATEAEGPVVLELEPTSGRAAASVACLPIEGGAEPLVLLAEGPPLREGGIDPGQGWVLEALVQFGRVALSSARMFERARDRSDRLQVLNEASLLVSSSLEVQPILDRLLDEVLRLTGAELAAVLGEEGGGEEPLGVRARSRDQGAQGISRSVVRQVRSSRTPLCVLDTGAAVAPLSESVLNLGLKSVMGVPLEVQDELIGVLYVSSRVSVRTFTGSDLDMLKAVGAHAALALRNAQQVAQIREKRAIEHELAIAHTIQQGFFPTALPEQPGLRLAGACQAAREVGGDFYDVLVLEDGRVALTLGDVSGKSVSAALYMAVARTALRMALGHHQAPDRCLQAVNDSIRGDLQDGSFITCFLAIYEPTTRRLAYASAGHHLGYLVADAECTPLTARGLPLGLDPEPFRERLESHYRTLAPGDRLVLFTDGVIEALSPDGDEFGEEGLLAALATSRDASAQVVADTVLEAIGHHVAGAVAWDDLTLLIAEIC